MAVFDAVKDYSTRDLQDAYFAVYSDDGKRIKILFNLPEKIINSMKIYAPDKINIR